MTYERKTLIMFGSLEDKMNHGQGRTRTMWGRLVRCAAVLLVTVVLFGGLYLGIRFLE